MPYVLLSNMHFKHIGQSVGNYDFGGLFFIYIVVIYFLFVLQLRMDSLQAKFEWFSLSILLEYSTKMFFKGTHYSYLKRNIENYIIVANRLCTHLTLVIKEK